jgi:putative colanic acid biosynthesis acetyltransferase WcaF
MTPASESKLNLPAGSRRPGLGVIARRVLWGGVYILLFRPWPRRLGNGWRAYLLRLFGAKIGRNTLLSPTMKVMKPWELVIGDYSAIGDHVNFYNFCRTEIGSMTVISQGCYLCTGSHDHLDPQMPLITQPIAVGNDAWIAANVFIHPGVSIGTGAVIGACAVVTKSMPEWTICAGHPCKPIKPRILKNA